MTKMLDSASTHAMIAVKDLSRAKDFYGGKLGLTATDERHGAAVRYETEAGTWFLVYLSEFAGTAKSTCMRFEVDDIEIAGTRQRCESTASTRQSTRSVLHANGASPLTFCASAISTSQPSCSSVSCTNLATVIDDVTACTTGSR